MPVGFPDAISAGALLVRGGSVSLDLCARYRPVCPHDNRSVRELRAVGGRAGGPSRRHGGHSDTEVVTRANRLDQRLGHDRHILIAYLTLELGQVPGEGAVAEDVAHPAREVVALAVRFHARRALGPEKHRKLAEAARTRTDRTAACKDER